MAKCQADIVGLVSGESTIIITVNIRMRKYWINLLDKKFVWKWSLLWWGLCVQKVKSNIQRNWWLSCQFAHDFLIWKKQVRYKQRCVQWMWEWKNFPEFTWIYLNLLKFTWIYLNLLEYTWIYLNSLFWKKETPNGRTDGPTDQRTDGRTKPLTEMRGRI